MSVHKVVFRLDFARACFSLLDRAGSICDKLADISDLRADSEEKFFQTIQENTANRLFSGHRKAEDGSEFVLFQISPLNLACHWEFSTGIRFEDVNRDERIQKLLRFSYEILTELKITKFSRAGLRFHALEEFPDNKKLETISGKLNSQLMLHVTKTLGKVTDCGYSIHGTGEDKVSYKLNFGPYFPESESLKFFENVGDMMKDRQEDNLYFDVDLFENQLTLQVNPSKWAAPLTEKALRLVNGLRTSLRGEVNDGNIA